MLDETNGSPALQIPSAYQSPQFIFSYIRLLPYGCNIESIETWFPTPSQDNNDTFPPNQMSLDYGYINHISWL